MPLIAKHESEVPHYIKGRVRLSAFDPIFDRQLEKKLPLAVKHQRASNAALNQIDALQQHDQSARMYYKIFSTVFYSLCQTAPLAASHRLKMTDRNNFVKGHTKENVIGAAAMAGTIAKISKPAISGLTTLLHVASAVPSIVATPLIALKKLVEWRNQKVQQDRYSTLTELVPLGEATALAESLARYVAIALAPQLAKLCSDSESNSPSNAINKNKIVSGLVYNNKPLVRNVEDPRFKNVALQAWDDAIELLEWIYENKDTEAMRGYLKKAANMEPYKEAMLHTLAWGLISRYSDNGLINPIQGEIPYISTADALANKEMMANARLQQQRNPINEGSSYRKQLQPLESLIATKAYNDKDLRHAALNKTQAIDVLTHIITDYKKNDQGGKRAIPGEPNRFISVTGRFRTKKTLLLEDEFKISTNTVISERPYTLSDLQKFFGIHGFDVKVLTHKVFIKAMSKVLNGEEAEPARVIVDSPSDFAQQTDIETRQENLPDTKAAEGEASLNEKATSLSSMPNEILESITRFTIAGKTPQASARQLALLRQVDRKFNAVTTSLLNSSDLMEIGRETTRLKIEHLARHCGTERKFTAGMRSIVRDTPDIGIQLEDEQEGDGTITFRGLPNAWKLPALQILAEQTHLRSLELDGGLSHLNFTIMLYERAHEFPPFGDFLKQLELILFKNPLLIYAALNLSGLETIHPRQSDDLNAISSRDIIALANSTALTKLTSLNLSVNLLDDESVMALANNRSLVALTHLDLYGNKIGHKGAIALAKSAALKGLTGLDLRWNKILFEGANELANSAELINLTSLNLSGCDIGSEGASALGKSTKLMKLTSLNIAKNKIGDQGAIALAHSLGLKGLNSIDLGYNEIGAYGAIALANSPALIGLTTLNLEGNSIGPAGKRALENSRNFPKLTSLKI